MARKRRRTSRPSERAAAQPAGAVRVQKILAAAGVASRRAAEDLIRAGRVTVNGKPVTALGTRANPQRDRVCVDGRSVGRPRRPVYYRVHKPRGVVTTTRDPFAKRTVLDLVNTRERVFPVGRLDAASEGLLLVTNDGALTQVLLHPSFQVPRTYRVSARGSVRAETLRRLERGIDLDGGRSARCETRLLERDRERSVVEIDLIEGRRHQIRDMMKAVGHPVRRLVRVRYGPLALGDLASGESRRLTAAELRRLRHFVAEARRARDRQRRTATPR